MAEQRRVNFQSVSLESLPGNRLCAQVLFEWRGETYLGTAEETSREHSELICAAKAACSALEAVVAPTRAVFEYLKCEPVMAVGYVLAAAALAIRTADQDHYTVGVCRIKEEPADAAVRAVLNATNRPLSQLLG